MQTHEENLFCYKETQISTDGKLRFFLEKHSTKEGTWGYLQVDEGEIDFVFLDGAGNELARERLDNRHSCLVIPPASLHKIVPISENFNASLAFYCKPHRYFNKKYNLNPVHHDLLIAYQTFLLKQGGLNILDVGCGSGRNMLFLALNGHSVTGIDRNEAQIEQINHIAKAENMHSVNTLIHDLNEPLSLQNQAYDFIFSTVTLQFLQPSRIPSLLTELQQATAPHGMHFFVFPIKTEQFISPPSFTYLAEKNELYHFYQDSGWAILDYKETPGQLHKTDESGKPLQGLFGLLLAQKN